MICLNIYESINNDEEIESYEGKEIKRTMIKHERRYRCIYERQNVIVS